MNFTFTAKVASNNGETFDLDTADIASIRRAEGTKGGTVIQLKSGYKRIVTDHVEDMVRDLQTAGINPRAGWIL